MSKKYRSAKRASVVVSPELRPVATAVARCLRPFEERAVTAFACAATLGLMLSVPLPAEAATFTVTNTNNSGAGSLRRAINNANANPGSDEVVFSNVSGTIELTSCLRVSDDLTITGPGASVLTLDANGALCVLEARDVYDTKITGLSLTGAAQEGIAVLGLSVNTILTVQNVTISGNGEGVSSVTGFGKYCDVIVENSVISGNGGGLSGSGTGISTSCYDSGSVSVVDSIIAGNSYSGIVGDSVSMRGSTVSGNGGGGIVSSFVHIEDSAISGNQGVGVDIYSGGMSIRNTTISGNTEGGVLADSDSGSYSDAIIESSTITGNSSVQGGGIANFDPELLFSIRNSIIAGNSASLADPDLSGSFGVDWTLIQDPGAATVTESIPGSNVIGVDPKLGPLQDNGGFTETHALLSSSPARDAGDPSFVPPPDFDQRGAGYTRVVGGRIDMGALEVQGDARIGDRVWDDANGDGIQDANELGKSDVTVRLQDCSGNVLVTTKTAANGQYWFSGLGAGSHRVEFVTPLGYALSPPLQGTKRGFDSDPDPATGLTGCRFTPDGKVRRGIDAGLMEQPTGTGQIGDRVWNDLDGDGIQDPGEPGLDGVTMRLLDCDGNELTTTISGPSGGYSFDALVAGQYKIGIVTPPGFVLSPALQGAKRGQDSNPDPATGATACIPMADGQTRLGIDAGLIQQAVGTGEIGDRVWDDTNRNGIQDPGEPGKSSVTVHLRNCTGTLMGTTMTDGNGKYLFENLVVGSYKIEFVAPVGYEFSPRFQGSKRGFDSDPFPATGLTSCLPMTEGKVRLGIDAGLVE